MLRYFTLEIICKFISFIEIEIILLCTVLFDVNAFFNIGKVDFVLTHCDSCYFDRVCSVAEPFLLVLYSPLHSKPEFYDVTIQNAEGNMQFDLYTGYEVVSLPKVCSRFFFFAWLCFGFLKTVLKVFLYDSCFMSEKMLYGSVYFLTDHYQQFSKQCGNWTKLSKAREEKRDIWCCTTWI